MSLIRRNRVAVIGAGPSGLSMLKQLREDGFDVTLYERRDRVGGLWAYTDDATMTTALPTTKANISKFTCGFSDYPIPEKYPVYLSQADFQEFLEGYAQNFDLAKDIVFHATLKSSGKIHDDKWLLKFDIRGQPSELEFDRVVFAHGPQTKACMPRLEGQDKFAGVFIHSQQFRNPEKFAGKKVVVIGLGSTAGDILPALVPHASKVYASHRRGAVIFKRLGTGRPADLAVTRRRRQIGFLLQDWVPGLAIWLANKATDALMARSWSPEGGLDPTWRLSPAPCVLLAYPASAEEVVPLLRSGAVESLHGLRRFIGPSALEFDDGTVVDGVDAVVCCTGYEADFSQAPWLVAGTDDEQGHDGVPRAIRRLFMNTFPPEHADSVCFLNHLAFGKTNGFAFNDVVSMGVSNLWRGLSPLPSRGAMEAEIDSRQRWIESRRRVDPSTYDSAVKAWEWQGFFERAAGTGMENLGWGWKGWAFWLRDRRLSALMNHGVETAFVHRFFQTGKRSVWPGARDAIIAANEAVKEFDSKTK